MTGSGRGRAAGAWRWCLWILLATAAAAGRAPGEFEVKAAFLFNFAKFVDWPEPSPGRGPIVIGVVGDDPFGPVLPQIVREQTVRGRRIEIRRFRADDDFEACHILFLSRSVAAEAEGILGRLRGRPVLTVSDVEGFAERGGTIGFALVEQSVRFDINLDAATAADLRMSAKLLAVARKVIRTP